MRQTHIWPGSVKTVVFDMCMYVRAKSDRYKLSHISIFMCLWCLSHISVFMCLCCLSGKLFDFPPFPSRCALSVWAIALSNSQPLEAWRHSWLLIQLSSIQQHWLFSFWLPHNGMCMLGFSGKHKSPWCFADNVPNCPHPLFSTPQCELIHSQLGRRR